jgi:hypothetical protein
VWVIFEVGSCIVLQLAWTTVLLFVLAGVAGDGRVPPASREDGAW